MKAEILKIAGVKSEKEFYKKYPTEAAFQKAHGKAFKKAKLGATMQDKGQLTKLDQLTSFDNPPQARVGDFIGGGTSDVAQPIDFRSMYDQQDYNLTGSTNAIRAYQAQQQASPKSTEGAAAGGGGGGLKAITSLLSKGKDSGAGGSSAGTSGASAISGGGKGGGGGFDMSQIMSMFKKEKGGKVKKYQNADNTLPNSSDPYMWGNPSITGAQQPVPTNLNGPLPNSANPYIWGSPPIGSQQAAPANPYANPPMMQGFQTGADPTSNPVTGSAAPVVPIKKQSGFEKILTKYGGAAGKIYGGFKKLDEEQQAKRVAKQTEQVAGLSERASRTKGEQLKRRYTRPEDVMIQPDQLSPTYGVGTNVLTAKDGMHIGGNPTEIQNMYNPGDIYQDQGFEPLSDSEIVKQYRAGGLVRMQTGTSGGGIASGGGTPWGAIGQVGSSIGGTATGNNAGGDIGGEVGGAIGSIWGPAGKAIGQIAGTVGGGLLDKNAKKIATSEKQTRQHIQNMVLQSGIQGANSQYSSYVRDGGLINYEEGGWMNPNYNPQVIAKFGNVDVSDMHNIATKGMDTLRTGGHIKQNQPSPEDQYAFGGELKTTWGGYSEPISYNKHMPGTGETAMFRGNSHEEGDGNGHTGIGVKYGDGGMTDYAEFGSKNADADVEVEKGEPMVELPNTQGNIDPETGELKKEGVVYGNLYMPNEFVSEIGDERIRGKKFKNIVNDWAKLETKNNKLVESSTDKLLNSKDHSFIGQLENAGLNANIIGANMRLKDLADKKIKLAHIQSGVNDTAKEMKIRAEDLAKGRIVPDKNANKEQARFGKDIFKAQTGVTTPESYPVYDADGKIASYIDAAGNPVSNATANQTTQAAPITQTAPAAAPAATSSVDQATLDKLNAMYTKAETGTSKDVEEFQKAFHDAFPDVAEKIIRADAHITGKGKKMGYKDSDLKTLPWDKLRQTNEDGIFQNRTKQYKSIIDSTKIPPLTFTPAPLTPATPTNTGTPTPQGPIVQPIKRKWWMDAANQVLPYLRPSDQEGLDASQLYGEMAALSDTVAPVSAQFYHPQLKTAYDISLQDQLNANQSDFNAIQRTTGYNPSATEALAAQKYAANSKVLGEQFRMNQAERMGTYNENIDTLNKAQLQNLGIADIQAERQSKAISNTKADKIAALNSISSKYAQQQKANRELGIMENMYNFRFDKKGRAINMNPLAQFDYSGTNAKSTGSLAPGYEDLFNSSGERVSTRKVGKDAARNGKIVKAIKNL